MNLEDDPSVTPYDIRERIKEIASAVGGVHGAELMMLMHYERSRWDWLGKHSKRGQHPDIYTYAGAYFAQAVMVERWGQTAVDKLRQEYPGQPTERLPNGRSYWNYASADAV